ncbi:MAG: signal peptidase I [Candidatus Bathyarchaeota archaeon]|nr:signal peptidase I [Candidatus Bathyarchaeota archaeon]MDH5495615.1 signal peptidase I [Candidatus Bathyarchaeota archaeon]
MSKLKDALKNEYVKSLILLAIILCSIVAFWFGLKTYLRTDYPLLAVASGSMIPTLNVGDLIIVQGGLNVDDIVAEYETGDVIVFHKPRNSDELIVHRAVEKHGSGDIAFLKTKGDNNPSGTDPWEVDNTDLVGKVVWSIPYLGQIPLLVRTPTGMSIIVILIVILILLEFVIPSSKEKKKPEQSTEETDVLNIGSL